VAGADGEDPQGGDGVINVELMLGCRYRFRMDQGRYTYAVNATVRCRDGRLVLDDSFIEEFDGFVAPGSAVVLSNCVWVEAVGRQETEGKA